MTERRYNDDEVAEIFRAAAAGSESTAQPGGSAEGLTLRDLQAIAREVDIAPEAISRAAESLDRAPVTAAAQQTFLGFPIAVERTVALQRRLTDTEWELLVVELRQVFRARGTVYAQGSLREWRNGNLHAALEPTPTGHQLRIGTLKGSARAAVAVGALTLGMSALVGVMVAANGALSSAAPGLAGLAVLGAAFVANGTFRLPGWARERARQIDGIIERLVAAQGDQSSQARLSDHPSPAAIGRLASE
jgi:hypothetical protein